MTPGHTRTDDDQSDDRRMFRRRSTDQPAPAKTFGYAMAVVSLVGCIFTAGYNWRSVSIVESNQQNFVRKDVQEQQFQNVDYRLREIMGQLEELKREIRAARGVKD